MKKIVKAGLMALSATFGSAAHAESKQTTLDLNALEGFTDSVGALLTYENDGYDLSNAPFYKFDTSKNDRLPSIMCVDKNNDGRITGNEDYRFNVSYDTMIYASKNSKGEFISDRIKNSPDMTKNALQELTDEQLSLDWAVFTNKTGEPLLVAVNTDKGLMVSSTVPDIPGTKSDQKRTAFGPCAQPR